MAFVLVIAAAGSLITVVATGWALFVVGGSGDGRDRGEAAASRDLRTW